MAARKPLGKAETIDGLLNAADEIFAEKGPNAASVREIAARANVNHGLLHRHFGNKDALLSAIQSRHMGAFKDKLEGLESGEDAIEALFSVLLDRPVFVRMLAFLILEHRSVDDYTREPGGVANFADILRNSGKTEESAKSSAAVLTAFSLGWVFFRHFTVKASGCVKSDAEMDDMAVEHLLRLLQEDARPGTTPLD